jgi:hypothetical protein
LKDFLAILRVVLGVVSVLLVLYSFLIILNVWFIVPKWPDESVGHSLLFHGEMTLGCISVGVALGFVARWSIRGVPGTKRDQINRRKGL